MNQNVISRFNQDVSDTSLVLAHARSSTTLPFSQEITKVLREWEHPWNTVQTTPLKFPRHKELIPFFEARYIMTDELIKKGGFKQVFELGSGLSPRGLSMTSDSRIICVELDLPETMRIKRPLVNRLCKDLEMSKPSNLFLEEGNACSADDIGRAIVHFRQEPIAVVTEGLLRTCDFGEKEALARHVHTILQHVGGAWITPDIELLSNLSEKEKASYRMGEKGEVNLLPNLFTDENHMNYFFHGLGFKMNKYAITQAMSRLGSPKVLGIPKEVIENKLKKRWTYVLTCA